MIKSYKFKSKTRPSTPHTVTLSEDNVDISCSCEAFLYSKREPQGCKHTDAVRDGSVGDFDPAVMTGGFVDPMLASKLPDGKTIEDFSSADWVLEEKYDGHRLVFEITGDAGLVKAWSRLGNLRPIPPHLEGPMRALPTGTFDGELYVPGGTSTDVKALENTDKLALVLFDVLRVENADSMLLPGTQRRMMLESFAPRFRGTPISISEQFDPTQANLLEMWSRGGEGGILKRRMAPYARGKRSKDWIKLKRGGQETMIVTGFLPGLLGSHAVVKLIDADGLELTVKTLDDLWRAEFERNAIAYLGRQLVVAYTERTRDGRYRHPLFDHFVSPEGVA